MKNVLIVCICLIGLSSLQAQELKWLSFEEAVEKNKTTPKMFLVDIYTDWCGWCKKMDRDTYSDPEVVAYINQYFYPVKLDGEHKETIRYNNYDFTYNKQGRRAYHELAATLMDGKLSYPTTVVLNNELKIYNRILGYKNAKDMEVILKKLVNFDLKSKQKEGGPDMTKGKK